MLSTKLALVLSFASAFVAVSAAPDIYAYPYTSNNIVKVNGLDDMCLIAPLNPDTDIGVAEGSGTKTYCTAKARYDDPNQGQLPSDWFTDAQFLTYTSSSTGAAVRQITGCINASHLSRLNPSDEGGQFDSSGAGNNGVPANSFCIFPGNDNVRGFYVQQIEPAENRMCIRCCINNDDCPHTNDTKGCMVAIPGYYGAACS